MSANAKIIFLFTVLFLSKAGYAVARRPLLGNVVNDWPDIERAKTWQQVLSCAGGSVVVDTALTEWHFPEGSHIYESDILRNDLQVVFKDKPVIRHLDAFAVRDFQSYWYTPNWDLLRNHEEVANASDADELVVRGPGHVRILNASMKDQISLGKNLPDYPYATGHSFFKDSPEASPLHGIFSRMAVYRDGNGLRVSLFNSYPFREITTLYFEDCK